ncbi:hypothetical protein PIB30_025611 [Stylosanthes scabra]|uniref:Retrotransposon Copia-like N-terminal domain-containing protein n=1 Tax=Stylosanthes scabra TaxID=79078 RepID=A0ABU6T9R8_9FABA|nr:hypothetical protein [Stylosanthes scabra]
MKITYSDSTTKEFSPLADKLNEDNYITWKYHAILTVESLRMEDHLESSKIPAQFIEDSIKKTAVENEAYKIWKDQDLTLTTWLVVSMSETFKNKLNLTLSTEVPHEVEDEEEETMVKDVADSIQGHNANCVVELVMWFGIAITDLILLFN